MFFKFLFSIALSLSVVGCATGGPLPSHVEDVPRGVRNNNPLNIVKTEIDWHGKVDCEDQRFECFSSAAHGIRAGYINLHSYHYRHGIDNLEDVIDRWSPSHENDTNAVYAFVRDQLEGVSRVGPNNIEKLLEALILSENGYNPYSREYIQEAIENVRNASRDNDTTWFVINRRTDEDVEQTSREQEAPMGDGLETGRVESGGQAVSKEYEGQGSTVDETYYRNLGRVLFGRPPVDCFVVRLQQFPRYVWMDRDARRLLVFHIRQECRRMEASGGIHPDPSSHPHALFHHWAILRREPRRPPPMIPAIV